ALKAALVLEEFGCIDEGLRTLLVNAIVSCRATRRCSSISATEVADLTNERLIATGAVEPLDAILPRIFELARRFSDPAAGSADIAAAVS
ncbi:hypothetical protein ABTM23_19255, partial [Acinetobacter baumannii]